MYTLSDILTNIQHQKKDPNLPLEQCQELLRHVMVWQFNQQFDKQLPCESLANLLIDKTLAIRPLGDLIDEDLAALSSIEELLAKTTLEIAEIENYETGSTVAAHQTTHSAYYDIDSKKIIVKDNPEKKLSIAKAELEIPDPELQALIRVMLGKAIGKHLSCGVYFMRKVEISPWIKGCDLGQFVTTEKHIELLTDNYALAKKMFLELLIQLLQLHHHGWLHGDVKTENILVTEDMSKLLLIDYRASQKIDTESTSLKGTLSYLPVEALLTPSIAFQDIYGAAITGAFWLDADVVNQLADFFNEANKTLIVCHAKMGECAYWERTRAPQLTEMVANNQLTNEMARQLISNNRDTYLIAWNQLKETMHLIRTTIYGVLEKKSNPLIQVLRNCFSPNKIAYPTMIDFFIAILNSDAVLKDYACNRVELDASATVEEITKKLACDIDHLVISKQIRPAPVVAFFYSGQHSRLAIETNAATIELGFKLEL